jgi:hypothetical protein
MTASSQPAQGRTIATFMAMAVVALLAALPDGYDWLSSLLRLSAAIIVGAGTYVAASVSAWRLAHRPQGPERHIIDMLGALRKSSAAWQQRFAGDAR